MDFNFHEGEILLIDKPLEWSSFQMVKKVKYLFKIKKIGHAGTLDPLATGLLLMGTGKKTKELQTLQVLDKEYVGTMILGATTPSFDLETEIEYGYPTAHISDDLIHKTAQSFMGEISQVPPIFSAVNIDGKRAYKHARKGNFIELKPRLVNIYEFEITHIKMPEVGFRVRVSKGTYIRSLVNDFGKALNSGAYLSALRRTKIGDFSVENAYDLNKLLSLKENFFPLESN